MSRTLPVSDHSGCEDAAYCPDAPSRIITKILVEDAIAQEDGVCEAGISAARAQALRIAEHDCALLAGPRDEIGSMRGRLAPSRIRAARAGPASGVLARRIASPNEAHSHFLCGHCTTAAHPAQSLRWRAV